MCSKKSRKTTIPIISLIFIQLFIGCMTSPTYYVVQVNGYTGGKTSIQSNKEITVVENPKAQNPLLEEEIAIKISNALKSRGFIISDNVNKSEYLLYFSYGIGPGRTYTNTYSYGGTRLNIYSHKLEPTTEVATEVHTEYTRHLILNLYETKGFSNNSKPVWIGEAYSTGSSSDLRRVINYLIRGAIAHFGIDTGTAKTHEYLNQNENKK